MSKRDQVSVPLPARIARSAAAREDRSVARIEQRRTISDELERQNNPVCVRCCLAQKEAANRDGLATSG